MQAAKAAKVEIFMSPWELHKQRAVADGMAREIVANSKRAGTKITDEQVSVVLGHPGLG